MINFTVRQSSMAVLAAESGLLCTHRLTQNMLGCFDRSQQTSAFANSFFSSRRCLAASLAASDQAPKHDGRKVGPSFPTKQLRFPRQVSSSRSIHAKATSGSNAAPDSSHSTKEESETKAISSSMINLINRIGRTAEGLTATLCYGGFVPIPSEGLTLFYLSVSQLV